MSTSIYHGPDSSITVAATVCDRCDERGACIEVDAMNGRVLALCFTCMDSVVLFAKREEEIPPYDKDELCTTAFSRRE